jgi:hypothetical protein
MHSHVLGWIEEAKAAARVDPLGFATMNSQTLAALAHACEKVGSDRQSLVAQYQELRLEVDDLQTRVDEAVARLERIEHLSGLEPPTKNPHPRDA